MDLRLISRTHYQVDEPAYIRALIVDCTSPVRTEYAEVVAARLVKFASSNGQKLNAAAASYGVDLGRALNVLTQNNNWSDLGHLVALCAKEHPQTWGTLSLAEQILFFRLFLEFDGAALIFFCRLLIESGPTLEINEWSIIANDLFKNVYENYLRLATNPIERTKTRQALNKRVSHPYSGKSGPHQVFIHLQTLVRIGLATRPSAQTRRYAPNDGTRLFLSLVPDIETLEKLIVTNRWHEIARQLFCMPRVETGPNWNNDTEVIAAIKSIYVDVAGTGISLCPLRTLSEALQIRQLCEGWEPWGYDRVLAFLKRCQANNPRSIRFHVDRIGRPAFVVFDREFLDSVV